jgi:hypothetical protein
MRAVLAILAQSDGPVLGPTSVVAIMAIGVLVALAGHIGRSRFVVAVGVGLIFLATAVMLVGAFLDYQGDGSDPRPRDAPGGF